MASNSLHLVVCVWCYYTKFALWVPTATFLGLYCLRVKQALPLLLLYRQERTQYDVTMQKFEGKTPSEIYGAEHLLRVFGERFVGVHCLRAVARNSSHHVYVYAIHVHY